MLDCRLQNHAEEFEAHYAKFFKTLEELCLHPERNSSSILRADILSDTQAGPSAQPRPETDQQCATRVEFLAPSDLKNRRKIRRKLLPRKPQIDKPLEQDCLFLTGVDTVRPKGLVVLLPDVKAEEDIPFYHPILRKLAFQYIQSENFGEQDDTDTVPRGTIKISVLPFTDSAPPVNKVQEGIAGDVAPGEDVNRLLPQRTVRTCMHLLETLHKHGWGQQRGYEKRVVHDVRRNLTKKRIAAPREKELTIFHIRLSRYWWCARTSRTCT